MTDHREPYTREEAARLLRVSEWTVGSMTRDGRLVRVPGLRAVRIVRASLDALLEGYDARDGESDRPTQAEAPSSRRRNRVQAHEPLAGATVGSRSPVPRLSGPSEGDVVIRRVEVRGR